jgi:hypothetical protein
MHDLDEPVIIVIIDIISRMPVHIIGIIDVIDIIGLICITFSAWVSVLNPIFQKMSSIK